MVWTPDRKGTSCSSSQFAVATCDAANVIPPVPSSASISVSPVAVSVSGTVAYSAGTGSVSGKCTRASDNAASDTVANATATAAIEGGEGTRQRERRPVIIFHDAGDWGGAELGLGARSEPEAASRPRTPLPSSHSPASSSTATTTEAPTPPPAPLTAPLTVTQTTVPEPPPAPPLRLQPGVPSDPIPSDPLVSEPSDPSNTSSPSSPVEAGFSLWKDLLHTALTDPLMITGKKSPTHLRRFLHTFCAAVTNPVDSAVRRPAN